MVETGQIYRHTRTQDSYKVLFVCPFNCNRALELDEKMMVVYQDIKNEKVWTRLEEEFFDEVEIEGEMKPRFQLVK